MSIIPSSSPSARSPRRRRWMLVLVVVLGVLVAFAMTGAVVLQGRGGLGGDPGHGAAPVDKALAVTWGHVGDQPVPESTAFGPRTVRRGLASGFTHDEEGAAVAAINISTRLTSAAGPDVYTPTARAQCVGDVDATLTELSLESSTAAPGAATPSELFFRITDGDPHGERVSVDIAARSPQANAQGGYLARTVVLVWIGGDGGGDAGGDWRVVLPTGPVRVISSITEYRSLGAIHG